MAELLVLSLLEARPRFGKFTTLFHHYTNILT
jgi:hypothetical protein